MIHDTSIVRVPASYRAMAFDGSTRLQPVELPLGETPRLQQHVDVVGFPKGGNSVS